MARGNVRTHARRTPGGGTTTVRQHSRKARGKGLVSPGHAWKLVKRAFGAARRKRRGLAFALGALAAGELTAWLTLRGASFMLATLGMLIIGAAIGAAKLSGGNL
jgi:hypothetical protein